jgi:hypothetical protein
MRRLKFARHQIKCGEDGIQGIASGFTEKRSWQSGGEYRSIDASGNNTGSTFCQECVQKQT